jgi:prophage antirepressor-like protein
MNELQKFEFEGIGVRTTIIKGIPYWVAKDVADILEYSETAMMTRRLDDDEFISAKLEGMNMKSTLITESGLYNAIIGSNKPNAKAFRKWITSEVLPQIRQKGFYSAPMAISQHTDTKVQKALSVLVNAKNFTERSVGEMIGWNIKNCKAHTGKSPKEVKEQGKELGLPSKVTQSAKEVIRKTEPIKAAQISMADDLKVHNIPSEKIFEVTKAPEVVKAIEMYRNAQLLAT